MKITLESTDRFVELIAEGAFRHASNDQRADPTRWIQARVWQGNTDSGIQVVCLIARIGVHKDQDTSQFDRELVEQSVPASPDAIDAYPLRTVL